ncbi:4-hydroxythreonine-4-phosphate dehydrogenase [Phyllobacterium trifolii]|uniref:4-hydroxythreonine-4-phosphate dehydrogenase n=1 Tax=Phyllobacterium trifolii TaxID=300193 RepID=A0A839UAD3_9HYPH|nr:4-hydroxythreonine-4-phosphate dehydrogenase PdxA [Phyllobacterium trifolii]MBB3146904.1 4-hydroxythreonine-4-phosphate dehydrogenase [Phyllobacterium trifolii]
MRIAITMGDPAGIGPEIALGAAIELLPQVEAGDLRLVIIGSHQAHLRAVDILGVGDTAKLVDRSSPIASWPDIAFLPVRAERDPIVFGQVSAEAGRFAYEAVALAVELALAGKVAALCTAPLNKEALNLGGHAFAGHTDMLAQLTGASDSVMMLAHGAMRVSHVTTHVALKDVPKFITAARIGRVVRLTVETLKKLGIEKPRIAVAALNPHAGEGGLFGREDFEVTEPLLSTMRAEGFDVVGPVPGDTVFVKLRAGQYDAVVAQYHDQGHIPVKLLGFTIDSATGEWTSLNGVNITLGLPIVRTSVDHGTAFDIAGKGVARASSLIEAINLAASLVMSRDALKSGHRPGLPQSAPRSTRLPEGR